MRIRIFILGLVFLSMLKAQDISLAESRNYSIGTSGSVLRVTLPVSFEHQSDSEYYESFTDGFTFIRIGKVVEGYEKYVSYLKESEVEYATIFSSSTDLKFEWVSSEELKFPNFKGTTYSMQRMSMMHASQPLITLHLVAEDKYGAFYAEARITAFDKNGESVDGRISEAKKIFSSLARVNVD